MKRYSKLKKIPENYIFILLLLSLVIMSACTITRKYGPFIGKVVDAETGEPIQGAAILIAFYTKGSSVGGWVYSFADAVETLTDAKGEFRIPSKRITLIKAMSLWDKDCQIAIFKPGYGAYPGHPKAVSSWKKSHSFYIPENEYITYYLPKLFTKEERKDNLFNINIPAGIPYEKMKKIRELKSKERVIVGFRPYKN